MAAQPVDWDDIQIENPGTVPGHWNATLRGTTPHGHRRVFLDVEEERDPPPDLYVATLLAEYGDVEPQVITPFEVSVSLKGRRGSQGYVVRGETKEHRVGVGAFPPD